MSVSLEDHIASRQRFSDRMRGLLDQALEKLDLDPSSEFDINIHSMIVSCDHRFHLSNWPIEYWAIDLQDLWREFICCAKGTPADDARQDTLAMQILQVRELGVVVNTEGEVSREARTEEGERIWVDLPYLVEGLRQVWEEMLEMKQSHRSNLAAFTARLVSVGVRGDELAFCFLQLCKQVLETERQEGQPTIAELLPAVSCWLRRCGEKINRLTVNNHVFADDARVLPGALAQAAGVQETGFSVARWLFWRGVVKDFAISGDEEVAKEGKRVFDQMMRTGKITQNRLPGESRYWEKVHEAMSEELSKRRMTGGKTSVGMEDIEVDLNWIDEE